MLPSPADEHRVDREVDLVEEVVLQQRLTERTVAVDHHVLAILALEFRYLRGDVPADEQRVIPVSFPQGRKRRTSGYH